MRILVGLENGMDGRPLAWALDHPGCYAFGEDSSSAVVNMAPAFLQYKAWIAHHTAESWLAAVQDVDIKLAEVWDVYNIDGDYNTVVNAGYEVNAWFRNDWKPLTRLEVRRGLQILSFSRTDLQESIKEIPAEELDRKYPNERWSIRGVLGHIANAEHWYVHRLGLTGVERRELPEDIFERLAVVRERLEQVLPAQEGIDLVRGKDGEFWSPRKMLRRAAWHERDHIGHIRKLLALSSNS